MKQLLSLIISLYLAGFCNLSAAQPNPIALSRSVVKIQALSTTGKQHMGSGVMVGVNKVATNCHVTRSASRAYVIKEDRLYTVTAQAALPEQDVCILRTQPVDLPYVALASSDGIKIGNSISVYGYPYALGIRMMPGTILALHPYAEANIIEINAGFTHGASGGAVFNSEGELVGLMTFMGQPDQKMRFYSIPAAWIALALKQAFVPLQAFTTQSFWEKGDFEHELTIP